MNLPFFKFDFFGPETGLVFAFIIGIGFGFFLERAGFGSARILAAQFYFTNMRVFKVMFTAIVTAMLGVFYLAWIGWLDISLIYMTDTYMVPQIAGGLILGMGFVIGGYCPGTGCVSAATGRTDGFLYLAGVVFGIYLFDETFPLFSGFFSSTPMGRVTIPEFFNISYGLVVFLVVLMALGGFMAAEWAEKFMASKKGGWKMKNLLSGLSLNKKLGLAAFLLGLIALFGADPFSRTFRTVNTKDISYSLNNNSDKITPEELAGWLIKGNADFTLIDLRPGSQYNVYNIPSSVNIPAVELGKAGLARNEKIVLYSDDETSAAQAWFLLKAGDYKSVYILAGGLNAWKNEILFPKLKAGVNAQELAEFEKVKQISIHFGGSPQTGLSADSAAPEIAMPKLQAPVQTAKASAPKKKKEGC